MSDSIYFNKCSRVLKALSDLNRLKILGLLFNGELCVSDMVRTLRIDQPKVSHHLSVLKKAGIILDRRDGRRIIYALHPASFRKSEHTNKIDLGFCSVEFRLRRREERGEAEVANPATE